MTNRAAPAGGGTWMRMLELLSLHIVCKELKWNFVVPWWGLSRDSGQRSGRGNNKVSSQQQWMPPYAERPKGIGTSPGFQEWQSKAPAQTGGNTSALRRPGSILGNFFGLSRDYLTSLLLIWEQQKIEKKNMCLTIHTKISFEEGNLNQKRQKYN